MEPHRNPMVARVHEPHRPLRVADILDGQTPRPAKRPLGDLPTLAEVDEHDRDDDGKDHEKGGGSV